MIKWKDDYNIGIKHIDEQHMKLFEIAGRAFELLRNELYVDKYDKITEILIELKEYTVFHFKTEEEYMAAIGYKKLLSHRVEHADFIEKVNNVDFSKIDEDQNKYIMDVLEFVVNWISGHILERDKLISAS